jgi:hypothetical protein
LHWEEAVYAITRRQHDKGTWYWKVSFSRRGVLHTRRFYDPKHGGSRKALSAAIAWRDKQLAALQPLRKLEFRQRLHSNNTSGVPGVHFLKPAKQPEGVWQAGILFDDGKRQRRTFSVLKHGYEKARRMAIAARREMLRDVADQPFLSDPVAKRAASRQAAMKAE